MMKVPGFVRPRGLVATSFVTNESFMNFSAGNYGDMMSVAILTNSQTGPGTWTLQSATNIFRSWQIVSNRDMAFPSTIRAYGTNFPSTGTKYAKYWHASNTLPVEAMSFYKNPGFLTASNLTIYVPVIFGATNTTLTQVNYDHIEIDGNPFCVCQQATVSISPTEVYSHSQSNGFSNTGPGIFVTVGKLYWLKMKRDALGHQCSIWIYDPDNFFSLVGTSSSPMWGAPGDPDVDSYWVRIQAHYLGNSDGYTVFGPMSFEWDDRELLPPPPPPPGGGGTNYNAVIASDNPSYWFKLDETSGTSAAEANGRVSATYSPNSGGVWTGGTNGAPGAFLATAKAAYFSNSVAGYVTAGDIDDMDGRTNVTVECWVKYVSCPTDGNTKQIFAKSNPNVASSWSLMMMYGARPAFSIWQGSTEISSGYSSTTDISDGNWHYIVGRYDGYIVSVWTDGVLDNYTSASGAFNSTAAEVRIGGDQLTLGGALSWSGFIHHAVGYTNALPDARISAHWLEGSHP